MHCICFIVFLDIYAWDIIFGTNTSAPLLADQDLSTCTHAGRHRVDIMFTYSGWQTRGTHNFTIVSFDVFTYPISENCQGKHREFNLPSQMNCDFGLHPIENCLKCPFYSKLTYSVDRLSCIFLRNYTS